MNITIDKQKIIAAIKETDDERVLFAINRLLQIEEDEIPDWHKEALDKRTEKIKRGEEQFFNWDDVKEEIKKID